MRVFKTLMTVSKQQLGGELGGEKKKSRFNNREFMKKITPIGDHFHQKFAAVGWKFRENLLL